MRTTTTWRRNFRRWSVQASTVLAAIGGIEAIAHAAIAFQSTLPLWKPMLEPWAFATLSSVLGVAIAILRNIPQEDV